MSDMNGKYKQIMDELENHIQDAKTLEFVKDRFSDLSMLFIDMLDRVTRLTDYKIEELETKQQEILTKINSVQSAVDGIESDIYEDESNYEFEIVCPYCNYEFATDIEDENKEEIQCPECHNTIELDWNLDEEFSECSGSCSHCSTKCNVTEEDYQQNDISKDRENSNDEDDKEDM